MGFEARQKRLPQKIVRLLWIDIQLPKRPKQAAIAEGKATYGNKD